MRQSQRWILWHLRYTHYGLLSEPLTLQAHAGSQAPIVCFPIQETNLTQMVEVSNMRAQVVTSLVSTQLQKIAP